MSVQPDLQTEIEKVTKHFYERGFREPFVGVWTKQLKDVQTPHGVVKFRVDKYLPEGSMMYLMPHEFFRKKL